MYYVWLQYFKLSKEIEASCTRARLDIVWKAELAAITSQSLLPRSKIQSESNFLCDRSLGGHIQTHMHTSARKTFTNQKVHLA